MQDQALHNRIMEVLRGRIAMGDGEDMMGNGRAKKRPRAKKITTKGGARKKTATKKRTIKKKTVTKRKPVKGGVKTKNPYIAFLKKHKGKGYTRKQLLTMYRKHKKSKK